MVVASNRRRLDEVTVNCPSPNLHTCPDSPEELIAGQPRSIWSTYAKVAERFDEKLVERWNSDMDVLLVYAALFTGVVTAFAITSMEDLEENFAQTTAQALRLLVSRSINETSSSVEVPTPFERPDGTTLFVNIVWFLSVIVSISACTGAMLCKTWCTKYRNLLEPARFPAEYKHLACERQKRLDAILRWNIGNVVDVVPGVLHLAVALFFLGLWMHLNTKNRLLGIIVGTALLLVTSLYAFFTILPLITDTPFSTPFTPLLLFIGRSTSAMMHRCSRAWKPLPWSLHDYKYQMPSRLKPFIHSLQSAGVKTVGFTISLVNHIIPVGIWTSRRVPDHAAALETRIQINALIWLLYMPLNYTDFCHALKTLLDLARYDTAEAFGQESLLRCIASSLRSVIHDDRIAEGRSNLVHCCIRMLAVRASNSLPRPPCPFIDLPLSSGAAFDHLMTTYSGETEDEVLLLSDSMWLRPSEQRGELSFNWANKHLRRTSLSDEALIELIQNAKEWLQNSRHLSPLPTMPDLGFLEETRLPSIEVIRIVLPYVSMLISPVSRYLVEEQSLSNILVTCMIFLRQQGHPRWISQVITTLWRDDYESVDQSVGVVLLDWVQSLETDTCLESLPSLLYAITYGPKVLPDEGGSIRPLTTLAGVFERVMKDECDSPGISSIACHFVQAYAATFEHAIAQGSETIYSQAITDLIESFNLISRVLGPIAVGDVLYPLTSLSSTFRSMLLDEISAFPKPNSSLLESELVRWICWINCILWRRRSSRGEESPIAPSASPSGRLESTVCGPTAAPSTDVLMTIACIYERVVDIEVQYQPGSIDLRPVVLEAYVSTLEAILIRKEGWDHNFDGYSHDIQDSLSIMLIPLSDGPKSDPKTLLLTLYPLALLFWRIDPSADEIRRYIGHRRSTLVELLIKTDGLVGDATRVECDLDIKFYAAELLLKVFKNGSMEGSEAEKIHSVLPHLNLLAVDETRSPQIRWKATCVLAKLYWYQSSGSDFEWWRFCVRMDCVEISSDLRWMVATKNRFADPGWENLSLPPSLVSSMQDIPNHMFLEESVFDWQNCLPILRRKPLSLYTNTCVEQIIREPERALTKS